MRLVHWLLLLLPAATAAASWGRGAGASGRVVVKVVMKIIMSMVGGNDQPTVFMFDDTQILYESFLEDVNGILNTGEVANLYTTDELMAIFGTIEKQAAAQGVNTGNQNDMPAH